MAVPHVTVIVNAHNGARYLREALESVYAQTVQDFEIVLFDDASTDATSDIARGFDERLRYFRSEELVPLGEARNRALEQARGRYVAFLDQDDLFLPAKLERQLPAFRGDVALVFSNALRFWEGTGREALFYSAPPPDGRAFRALLRKYYLPLPTVMIRRDALSADQALWFPSSFGMCEEVDLFLRLAHAHPIAYVDEVLAKYRIHGENFSIRRRELVVSEQNAMVERFSRLIPGFDLLYAEEAASLRAQIKRSEAQLHWRAGRRGQAWTAYREGWRLRPRAVFAAEMLMSRVLPFEALPALRRWIGRPM